jgi:hypothetical protein
MAKPFSIALHDQITVGRKGVSASLAPRRQGD